jgi:hypothetical protein
MTVTTFKFAPNVQAKADVKYMDIVPGQYGPQIRIKGKINGKESVAYLPGKLPDVITVLVSAGVIPRGTDYLVDVEEAFEIKPLQRQFTMMKQQAAGEKNGTLAIFNGAAASAAVPATGNSASAAGALPAPQKSYADIYSKATDFIIDKIVPKYRAAKLDPTAADVHAMVATLFIPKSKES